MTGLEMYRNRLSKVYKIRSKWSQKNEIFCFRIYDSEIPQVQLTLEKWMDRYVIWDRTGLEYKKDPYAEERWEEILGITKSVLQISDTQLIKKQRIPQKGKNQYDKKKEVPDIFFAREGDLEFEINASNYVDLGLFLDHRITRRIFRDLSKGKSILNLFCYTGSFTLNALRGGASSIVQVDLSPRILDWNERNLEKNGYNKHSVITIEGDILQYLEKERKNPKREKYDLILLDPPTFSNSKRMEKIWTIEKNAFPMVKDLVQYFLKPKGKVLFSTNFKQFKMDWPIQFVDRTKETIPEDFRDLKIHQLFEIGFDAFGQ